ncbi:hypothetical protein FLONG3_1478 [Fusarium longipes]|uniref:Uncharacterized protein n=1 Tax=Fusarium longipes TaxID=694270 RepID=A0A395T7C6_9HYPO|nr:hypothetical protein FLONG3_1478 [Fusarium longipes]
MGLIGLVICSIMGSSQDNGARSGGYYSGRNQTQQIYTTSPGPQYTYYAGRSSCYQRKMDRRAQRQLQRADRWQLRADQRAQRRQAGVMLVESGARRVGLVGQPKVENISDMRVQREANDSFYELDGINQQHIARDAPPSYDEVVRK